MKSLIFIILLSTTCTSQVLTHKAKTLQSKNLQQFHGIETFAFSKWKANDIMRLREINDQVEAYFEVQSLIQDNFRRNEKCMKAIRMHSRKSKRKNPLHNPTIDWRNVLFELKSWINHKKVH